jgi:hypothetical protein
MRKIIGPEGERRTGGGEKCITMIIVRVNI